MGKDPGFVVPAFYGWPTCPTWKLRQKTKHVIKRIAAFRDLAGIDSIAFCGSSGAAMAFAAACELDLNLIYVRKKDEQSHGNRIEMNGWCHKYVIVDDLIETGSTIHWIQEQISDMIGRLREQALHRTTDEEELNNITGQLCGIVLYDNQPSWMSSVYTAKPIPIIGDNTDMEKVTNLINAYVEEQNGDQASA